MTAVAFTGGKDSVLALHIASGFRHPLVPPLPADVPPVKLLVTFGGSNPDFKAHPLPIIKALAKALKLPHVMCEVDGQPTYQASYARQLRGLAASQHGITALVTGDILDVAHGFMEAAVAEAGGGLQLVRPLWQLPRASVLQAGLDLGIRCRISCVDVSKYGDSSSSSSSSGGGGGGNGSSCGGCGHAFDATVELLGQELTPALVAGALADAAKLCSADLAGERGEFHTLVTACPLMGGKEVRLQAARVQCAPASSHVYIEWHQHSL